MVSTLLWNWNFINPYGEIKVRAGFTPGTVLVSQLRTIRLGVPRFLVGRGLGGCCWVCPVRVAGDCWGRCPAYVMPALQHRYPQGFVELPFCRFKLLFLFPNSRYNLMRVTEVGFCLFCGVCLLACLFSLQIESTYQKSHWFLWTVITLGIWRNSWPWLAYCKNCISELPAIHLC